MNADKSPLSSNRPRWPRKVKVGRITVPVYRRKTPSGHWSFMVANYAEQKRRFDCYNEADEALREAAKLAKRLSERDVISATMTRGQSVEYASAAQILKPLNIPLLSAVGTVAEAIKYVGDLPTVLTAAKDYATRHKITQPKRVGAVVKEFLANKQSAGAKPRYLQDLRSRLARFSEAFKQDICNITTSDIQSWFDRMKFAPRNYTNFRTVLHTLFEYAITRGFAADNPVTGVEKRKVKQGDTHIFKPEEIARLLAAATPEFLPCIALGAFAGLRSAEIERLEWSDIDLVGKHITVGVHTAKTASRRVVPVADNLVQWLIPYSEQSGKVWKGTHDEFYEAQQATAAATEVKSDSERSVKAQPPVKWKSNALRHSYASYRFAQCGDAGRVAGELGNSAEVVHKHYRELVKPVEAQRWFGVKPIAAPNVVALPNRMVYA